MRLSGNSSWWFFIALVFPLYGESGAVGAVFPVNANSERPLGQLQDQSGKYTRKQIKRMWLVSKVRELIALIILKLPKVKENQRCDSNLGFLFFGHLGAAE